jgi:hypothetical protein
MKNKKSILKYQFSGVMQDATTVKKPDRQIVVKNNNDNWKQLVAKNQPKQQTRLFELTPEIKKDIEEHTKKGDVQLTNGEWITKEEYNKLKAKKSTGAINPDYSDPITMGITMATAPAQGLLKTASQKVLPKLANSKVVAEGVDMLDPTSLGLGLKELGKYKIQPVKGQLNSSLLEIPPIEIVKKETDFKPVIKDYKNNTEMFTDFLKQGEKQGVNIDRNSKLYKQIQAEIPEANKYYKGIKRDEEMYQDLINEAKYYKLTPEEYAKKQGGFDEQIYNNYHRNLSDDEIADALYLSIKTEQAQKGLKDSKVKDLLYHGTGTEFNIPEVSTSNAIYGDGFYMSNSKKVADFYKDRKYDTGKSHIKPLFASINNPKIQLESNYFISNPLTRNESLGNDSVIGLKDTSGVLYKNKNKTEFGNKAREFITFQPTQVKSLFREHLGKWDWDNPNIHKGLLLPTASVGLGVKAASNQESKKQGGVFKEGGKIDCGCNIDKDEIDTDVLFDLPQQIFDLLGKSIGLKKGTKYDNKVKDKLKEDAKLNNMNLRDYLMKNPDVSKHITIIEMKRQGGLLGYQTGGLVSNITNSQNVNNKTNEVVMQYNIKQPVVKELQQGGQLDEKQFIQWLAQQLGATDENDFKQKVQKLGKGGIEKAKQMFMQQSQKMEQGGYLPRYKRGGIFKYQNAGVFRSFADTENRSVNNITEDPQKGTKKSSYTFIPGTYDVESKVANTYNNINSSQQFDAGTTNAQSKIDYSKGVGQRTQSGLQGNRGKQGINLTDRLASERQDVQNTFEKVYNTPEFTKRMYKAKDGNTYLLDTTGKYVIGKLDQKEETVPPTPTSANPKINRPVRFGLVVADNKEMADGKVAKGTLTFELGTDKENKEYLRQADPKTANSLLMLNSADNPYDTGKHTSFNDGQNERAFYQKQLEDLMKDENSELRKLLKSYQNKATATEQEVLEKPKPTINRLGGILKYQSRKWR